MAGRCDILYGMREVRMVRIDHSDIYLENERLSEELVQNLDLIRRDRYRQVMAREAEILKLKQSVGLTSADDNDQGQGQQRGHVVRVRRVGVFGQAQTIPGAPPTSATNSFASTISAETSGPNWQQQNQRGSSPPVSFAARIRAIDVQMPSVYESPENGAEDTVDGSFGHGRRASVFDSDTDSDVMSSGPFGRSQSRQNKMFGVPRRRTSVNKSGAGGQPAGPTRHKSRVETMMDKMKLEKFPDHWYTSVVEATDVNHGRRGNSARSRSSPQSTPMFPKNGDKSRRPQTSIGIGAAERSASAGRGTSSRGRERSKQSIPPPPENFSTVVCQGPPTSKTRRQLLEMVNKEHAEVEELQARGPVERCLRLNREKSRMLQDRVKDFVKSLEEMEKARKRGKDILDRL